MVNIEKAGDIEIVSFSVDRINALIAEEIREQVVQLFDNQHAKVAIDLKGVNYIDSSGFGCLLSILRAAKNNYGILKIMSPESSVKSLFETLYLHTVFDIYPDTEQCLRSFR
jgi:anti-anti-sigma factor